MEYHLVTGEKKLGDAYGVCRVYVTFGNTVSLSSLIQAHQVDQSADRGCNSFATFRDYFPKNQTGGCVHCDPYTIKFGLRSLEIPRLFRFGDSVSCV